MDGHEIGFNRASNVRLDVAEFEDRCKWAEQVGSGSRMHLYRQALSYYRGDLLIGWDKDWCRPERARLKALYQGALSDLAGHRSVQSEDRLAVENLSLTRLRSEERRVGKE